MKRIEGGTLGQDICPTATLYPTDCVLENRNVKYVEDGIKFQPLIIFSLPTALPILLYKWYSKTKRYANIAFGSRGTICIVQR